MTTYSVERTIAAEPQVIWDLLTSAAAYEVTPNGDGTSEFSMEEVFSGLMEPLISKSIPDQTESFNLFADGLKAAAEAS